MNQAKSNQNVSGMIFLFAVTYMISYITRINYGAIVSEMESATGSSKSLLSMALTGSFITYGTGQIISGICGDKISPKKMVSFGLIITVFMNLFIPICQNPFQMLAVWSINGFAQSFMWPPLVKITSAIFPGNAYKNAVTKISWGSSLGTILVYMLSPLLISVFSWKSVFLFSAAAGIVMIVIWNIFAFDTQTEETEKNTTSEGKSIFSPIIFLIMIAIILQGMLRDGITTWMPSYISETYNLSNEISIFTGIILPIFSILSFQLTTQIYTKKLKNPMTCAGFFFGLGAIFALCLSLVTGHSAGVSVFMSAALTGCMHGVNLILICMLPQFFQKTGKVSTISGILNSCTYIGSAISTYGIAVLSEQFGWSFTILVWLIVAVLGTIICLACSKKWSRYKI